MSLSGFMAKNIFVKGIFTCRLLGDLAMISILKPIAPSISMIVFILIYYIGFFVGLLCSHYIERMGKVIQTVEVSCSQSTTT